MKRLFAFGCSYTKYVYPTWSDYLGVTFDQYYNFAAPGSSNTFMMNRLVEVMCNIPFNSETDTVAVMLTGFCRFSYKDEKNRGWKMNGDLHTYTEVTKDPIMSYFLKNIYNDDFAVYQSWIAAQTIKTLLISNNIKHYIFMGIDNSMYLNDPEFLNNETMSKSKDIYNLLDYNVPVDEWKKLSSENGDRPLWHNGMFDSHPSHRAQFKFFSERFPEAVNDKSISLKKYWDKNLDKSSQTNQSKKFDEEFRNKYDLASKQIFLF